MLCGKFVDQLRPGFQAYGAKLVQQLTVIALVEQRRRLVSQLLVQIGLRRVRRILHGGTAVLRFANMKCERMRLRRGDLELQCCGIVFGQLRNASAHLAFLRARLPRRLRLRWELEFDLGAQGWVVVILQLTVILLREVLCVPLPRPCPGIPDDARVPEPFWASLTAIIKPASWLFSQERCGRQPHFNWLTMRWRQLSPRYAWMTSLNQGCLGRACARSCSYFLGCVEVLDLGGTVHHAASCEHWQDALPAPQAPFHR